MIEKNLGSGKRWKVNTDYVSWTSQVLKNLIDNDISTQFAFLELSLH